MNESRGHHLIKQPKKRIGSSGGGSWWTSTPRRLACKFRARELIEIELGGEELMLSGRGIYSTVPKIFEQVKSEFPDVFEEYLRDKGKDITQKILGDRVHKMYYSYLPKEGKKYHGRSTEHPIFNGEKNTEPSDRWTIKPKQIGMDIKLVIIVDDQAYEGNHDKLVDIIRADILAKGKNWSRYERTRYDGKGLRGGAEVWSKIEK